MSRESFYVDLEDSTDISDIIDRMIEHAVEQKEKEMQGIIDDLQKEIDDLESEIKNLVDDKMDH
jgi:SMC interacting uncharacterized protein involved in chromosome segregation